MDTNSKSKKEPKKKRRGLNKRISKKVWLPIMAFLLLVVLGIGFMLNQVSNVVTIAGGNGGFDRDMGRINVLVLGVDDEANLTDTIMLMSFDRDKEEMAMISIPRDLWVDMPGNYRASKINTAYALGEREEKGRGIEFAREVVENISGVTIDRVIVVNTEAFVEVVDIMDGVEVVREEPFVEGLQWHGSGRYSSPFWHKARRQVQVEGQPNEDGETQMQTLTREFWVFSIPEGAHTLDGRDALYYVRSRHSSSDFDRAARQQEVVASLKDEIMSLGLLRNPARIIDIYQSVERNVETDISLGEIRELVSMARNYSDIKTHKKVFDTSEEGLLISSRTRSGAYILLPRTGDFSEIQGAIQNMFNETHEEHDNEEDNKQNVNTENTHQ